MWVDEQCTANFEGGTYTGITASRDSQVSVSGSTIILLSTFGPTYISGGEIFRLHARGSSTVAGGRFDTVIPGDDMNITAGEIRSLGVGQGDRVNLFGGRVETRIGVNDGILNVFGGTISGIDATVPIWEEVPTPNDFTRVNIFDVIAQPSESPYSLINIEGGWMNDIYGGTFDIPVVTHGEAITHIRGGSYSEQFEVGDDALMHVYGYDLDWTDDRLTGTLSDGTPLDAPRNRHKQRPIHPPSGPRAGRVRVVAGGRHVSDPIVPRPASCKITCPGQAWAWHPVSVGLAGGQRQGAMGGWRLSAAKAQGLHIGGFAALSRQPRCVHLFPLAGR